MIRVKQKAGCRLKRFEGGSDFLMGAGIGIVFFLLVYGVSTLNVTYDSWIYNGYIEQDIIQRYAGWLYYRNAEWDWPLAIANNMSIPHGASIVFTDSVPLVAVLCKIFSPLLPETFQYIGWYNLINCALQGGFAALLLRHFRLGKVFSAAGSLFFVCAPIFVERLFRHDALASQWMVLAALLLYFRARHEGKLSLWGFVALCAIAPGVTTYFVPMVYMFLAVALLEDISKNRRIIRPAMSMAACVFATLVSAYVFGILTRGGGGSAFGFGTYSMNLNALFNPTSFDWYAESAALGWSAFLPILPQYSRQYDGFNYLGMGLLLGLTAMALCGLLKAVQAISRKDMAIFRCAWRFVKEHIWLILACLCLTLFAFSNVVTWGETTLFVVPLPDIVQQLCGIFRASGRLFWPCSYLLVLSVVLWCAKVLQKHWRMAGIVLLVLVQLVDIFPTLYKKHQYFSDGPIVVEDEFSSEGWEFLASNYHEVYCLGDLFDYRLAAGIIRYNPQVQTNMVIANRGNFDYITATYEPMQQSLRSGQPLPDGVMYICGDEATFDEIMQGLHPDARGYRVGDFYVFANPLPGCPLPEYLPEGANR